MKPNVLYGCIGSILFLIAASAIWYSSQEEGTPPEKKLDIALELLKETGPKSLSYGRQARKLAQELKAIQFRLPKKPDYMYILGVTAFRDAMDRVEDGESRLFRKTIFYLNKRQPGASYPNVYKAEEGYMLGVSNYYLGNYDKALRLGAVTYKYLSEEKFGFSSYLLASVRLDRGELEDGDGPVGAVTHNSLAIQLYEKLDVARSVTEGVIHSDGKSPGGDVGESTESPSGSSEIADKEVNQDGVGSFAKILDKLYLQKVRIYLQLAQVNMKKGLPAVAKENLKIASTAIEKLPKVRKTVVGVDGKSVPKMVQSGQSKLLEAQVKMAEGKYKDALVLVESVENDRTLSSSAQRMARFLNPYCVEKMNKVDNAIRLYKKVAKDYSGFDEGRASDMRLARLLMSVNRDEESIVAFESALKLKGKSKVFMNRWVSRKDAMDLLEKSWQEWVDKRKYGYAIQLSGMLYPLFSLEQAARHKADASLEQAEDFESARFRKTAKEKESLENTYRRYWREAGQAHSELAETLKLKSGYSKVLEASVRYYKEGRDITRALAQLELYIKSESRESLPGALLMRGKLLMDKARYDDAISDFATLMEEFPTDSAVFEAQYLIGLSHREKDEHEKAEQVWRELLEVGELTPDAKEWRHSMYSLAELLFSSGVMLKYEAGLQEFSEEERETKLQDAYAKIGEAAVYFSEFLRRYGKSPNSDEARFYLAKSRQYYAELPKMELAKADTGNAKQELRDQRQELLGQASKGYQKLIESLVYDYEEELLDDIRLQIYTDSHFLYARTLFQLGEYDSENYKKAIVAFNAASTRFSDDPQVLLAYIQVAICYQKLEDSEEARGVLSQAGVILENLPAGKFSDLENSSFTSAEWSVWLKKFRQSQGFVPIGTAQEAVR